MISDGDKV